MTDRPPSGPSPTHWLPLVLVVSLFLYLPAVQNDFVWDDNPAAKAVTHRGRNPNIIELHGPAYYYTHGYWPQKDPGSPNYRPLTVYSFALSHAVFGEHAAAAHLLTVLAHVLAVLLAFLVLRSLGANRLAANLGALVFGVHAIHSEAVCAIVGRAESLAFAAGAASLLALRKAVGEPPTARALWLALAGLALFVSCSFKESGIAWAAFGPLSLWLCKCPSRPTNTVIAGRSWIAVAIAMLVPAVVFVLLRASFLAAAPPTALGYFDNPHLHSDTFSRVLSSLIVWGYGLLVTLLPFHLGADHGPSQFPIVQTFGAWAVVAIAIAIGFLGLLYGAWRARKTQPLLTLGICCFLGFSAIVSNVFFPVFLVFGERTYYTPSFGLSLVIAGCLPLLTNKQHLQPLCTLALGGWLGFSACKVWDRHQVWRSDATLIEHEVLHNPSSLRMRLAAAKIANARGQYGLAQQHLDHAQQLDPEEPRTWLALASLSVRTGNLEAARRAVATVKKLPARRFHTLLQQRLQELDNHLRGVRQPMPAGR